VPRIRETALSGQAQDAVILAGLSVSCLLRSASPVPCLRLGTRGDGCPPLIEEAGGGPGAAYMREGDEWQLS
jgi:hypothetical protein